MRFFKKKKDSEQEYISTDIHNTGTKNFRRHQTNNKTSCKIVLIQNYLLNLHPQRNIYSIFSRLMNVLELSEQEIGRRQSLQELREMGIDPYPAAEYPTMTGTSRVRYA